MIEETLITKTPLISEAEQLRKAKRTARRKHRRILTKKSSCQKCGQPKHYICL